MSLDKLSDLNTEAHLLRSAWQKNLLTIASGGFALLAGLGPKVPPVGMGKYFLAGAWICLGIGIISGAAAIYTEVDRANRLLDEYKAALSRNLETRGLPTVSELVVANPHRAFSFYAPRFMVVSLILAVGMLVIYSVLNALNA